MPDIPQLKKDMVERTSALEANIKSMIALLDREDWVDHRALDIARTKLEEMGMWIVRSLNT